EAVLDDPNYQQAKLDSCREKGISLLSVYEDEWRDKRAIVESMIVHRLGLSKKLNARSLRLASVALDDAATFMESNHLEGAARSLAAFGLFDCDVLIACMTLRRPFHKKHSSFIEVARSACAAGF